MFLSLVVLPFLAFFGFICSYVIFKIGKNYVLQQRFLKISPKMPVAPESWGMFGGHTHLYCKMGNIKHMTEQHKITGEKTMVYFINHQPLVVTIDYDLVKKYAFEEKNDHIVRPPLGSPIIQLEYDCLISASGDQLSRLRPVYAGALSNRNIKSLFVSQEMKRCVNELVDSFDWRLKHHSKIIKGEASVEIDLDDLVSRYTVDLIFSTLYRKSGLIDYKSDSSLLVQAAIGAPHYFLKRDMSWFMKFPLFNTLIFHLIKATEFEVSTFLDMCFSSSYEAADIYYKAREKYVKEKVKAKEPIEFNKVNNYQLEDGKKFKRGLVDFIIDKLYDKTITPSEYKNSTVFLHTAAERTSSDLIVYIIVCLAVHMNSQDKLRASILKEGEKSQYLNWCILEAVRLMPPVPGGSLRVIEKDITTNDGILIPKGTHLSAPPYGFHRVKEIWGEDAEEYRPERWADEKNFLPCQFIGFGTGRRICPGRDFAMVHIKLLLVSLLTKFKFEPSPKTDYKMNFSTMFFIILLREKHSYVMMKHI